jgi:hypothetical protein
VVFGNGENFVLAGHLDIFDRLACDEGALEGVLFVEEADFVVGEEEGLAFVIAESDFLEGAMVVQEGGGDSVDAPLLAVDNEIVFAHCSEDHF